MTSLTCERLRDRLPAAARGGEMDAALREHVESCTDCAAELTVLRVVRGTPATVPDGLDTRILERLRAGEVRTAWSARRLAMAAMVAFALVTGGILMNRGGEADPADLAGLPADWLNEASPPRILSGAPGLEALSEDELIRLLEEMES